MKDESVKVDRFHSSFIPHPSTFIPLHSLLTTHDSFLSYKRVLLIPSAGLWIKL